MNTLLSLVVLKTKQVERVCRFYRSIGIEFAEERHGNGPLHYSARIGEVVLEIYPLAEANEPPDPTTRLGFSVANLAGLVQRLQEAGVPFASQLRMTEWGLQTVVRDPDGRACELYER